MAFEDMEFGSYDRAEKKAQKAFEFYEDGKMLLALAELETALEINPANSSWHFNKALALDSTNRFDDAIAEYEIALQLDGNDVEILNSLAVDYTRTGQYDRAIEMFEHIEKLSPAFEPCYCNRIITYTEMGLHDLAEQMFYLAQQIKPDCGLCYYNIGNSLFIRGQYDKAINCWRKTAELEPTHPQINYRIAQACWSKGDTARAREHFLAELRSNAGDINVILDFGLFLLEVGDVESAKEKFNRILEFEPDSAVALFYLGEIAFNLGDYEWAVELLSQALEKDGSLAGPRYRLSRCALILGQRQKGKAYLVSELKLGPENPDVLVSMGSMFLAIDEPHYARHCLLKAVDIDFTNPQAYYYLGLASALYGQTDDAAEFFNHTLDLNPGDVRTLRACAAVYLAMGRLDDAAKMAHKARALPDDDAELACLCRRIRFARAAEHVRVFLGRFKIKFGNGRLKTRKSSLTP